MNPNLQRRIALIFCGLLSCVLVQTGWAAESSKESQLKAAFLYNFAKFVEWPASAFASADSPIVIGIVGKNPFGSDLEKAVKDRTINGHPLEITMMDDTATNVSAHVLFFGPGQDRDRPGVLARLAGLPILTVGDSDRFIADGGMINFVFEADKVRFEINPEVAGRAGLRISANLLKLARKVSPP